MNARNLILLLLPFAGSSHAAGEQLTLEVVTRAGLRLEGQAVRVDEGGLLLQRGDRPGAPQFGVAVGDLRGIALTGPLPPGEALLVALEPLLALLPHLDDGAHAEVLARARAAGEAGGWRLAYRWAERLCEIGPHRAGHAEAALLKAWALHELGLHARAAQELDALEPEGPLHAQPRHCWLRARLALQQGRRDEALEWALLPGLRIPAASGPLADELAELARSLAPST